MRILVFSNDNLKIIEQSSHVLFLITCFKNFVKSIPNNDHHLSSYCLLYDYSFDWNSNDLHKKKTILNF